MCWHDALVSKANNVERQLANQKSAQAKRLTRKEESISIFTKISLKPTNGGTFNKKW